MAYTLRIVSGDDVREVEFTITPTFADMDSAIRSVGGEAPRYKDEDGDLCTLLETTFPDFLITAQTHQEGKSPVLQVLVAGTLVAAPCRDEAGEGDLQGGGGRGSASASMILHSRGAWQLRGGSELKSGSWTFRDNKVYSETGGRTAEVVGEPIFEPISSTALPEEVISLIAESGCRDLMDGPCIKVCKSEIMKEIQKPVNQGVYFVLPSQLNGAEYPSHTDIIQAIEDYKFDNTGGPRGQLAVHPAAGQFVLDNAASEANPDGINAIDEISKELKQYGFGLKNGYLTIPERPDREALQVLQQKLHTLRPLVMKDVIANGITPDKRSWSTADHRVNLVYASAVPVNAYQNHGDTEYQLEVAELVLVAQYYGALKFAADHASEDNPAKVFLMPLGGGVFNNPWHCIARSMSKAVEMLEGSFGASLLRKLDISVLTWEGKPEEYSCMVHELRPLKKLKEAQITEAAVAEVDSDSELSSWEKVDVEAVPDTTAVEDTPSVDLPGQEAIEGNSGGNDDPFDSKQDELEPENSTHESADMRLPATELPSDQTPPLNLVLRLGRKRSAPQEEAMSERATRYLAATSQDAMPGAPLGDDYGLHKEIVPSVTGQTPPPYGPYMVCSGDSVPSAPAGDNFGLHKEIEPSATGQTPPCPPPFLVCSEEAMPSAPPGDNFGQYNQIEPSATGQTPPSPPCIVCSEALELHLPAPVKNWICNVCNRDCFTEDDPMWGCRTAKDCDWGMCMQCYDVYVNFQEPSFEKMAAKESDSSTTDECIAEAESRTATWSGISSDARICRGAHIEDGARVGPRAYISSSARVMRGATIGADAKVLGRVAVEADAVIGEGSILDGSSRIGCAARIGKGVRIQGDVRVGEGAVVGDRCWLCRAARVGRNASLGSGSQITGAARVEDRATVGENCCLNNRSYVAAGAALEPGRTLNWKERVLGVESAAPSCISTQAHIDRGAHVEEGAHIGPGAWIAGSAWVMRGAVIEAGAQLHGRARVEANAVIGEGSQLHGEARVAPGARVGKRTQMHGSSRVDEEAVLGDDCRLHGSAYVGRKASVGAGTHMHGCSRVGAGATVGEHCHLHGHSYVVRGASLSANSALHGCQRVSGDGPTLMAHPGQAEPVNSCTVS